MRNTPVAALDAVFEIEYALLHITRDILKHDRRELADARGCGHDAPIERPEFEAAIHFGTGFEDDRAQRNGNFVVFGADLLPSLDRPLFIEEK